MKSRSNIRFGARGNRENSLSLQDGDIIFLGSDGVWDLVSATEIAEKTEKGSPFNDSLH